MSKLLLAHAAISSDRSHQRKTVPLSYPLSPRRRGDAISSEKMRVFIVEDDDLYLKSLVRLLVNAPEKDMQVVGSSDCNGKGLADEIKEKRVDVVVADIVLQPAINREQALQDDKISGVVAISTIRRVCGENIKIVGISNYPEYKDRAIEAGANIFFAKGKATELREAIRRLYQNLPIEPPKGVWIGSIIGLELFPDKHPTAIVVGDRGKTPKISLAPRLFGLLYYLAKERINRSEGDGPWLAKKTGETVYKVYEEKLWSRCCQTPTIGGSYRFDDGELTKWCSDINKEIRPYVYQGDPNLLIGPGGGSKSEGSYSLSSQIVSDYISIADDPLSEDVLKPIC